MTDKKKIKAFVQDVLGCGCAEEVFLLIELRQEEMAGKKYDHINVGNRLLIYVFRTGDARFVAEALQSIVLAGKEERDAGGFNRFRLVLATDATRAGSAATKAYDKLAFLDDRIHLHVIGKSQVTF